MTLSIIENIFIPSWILLWGFGAWLLLAFPYKAETQDRPTFNPATGLPMMNTVIDIEGNLYGINPRKEDDGYWDNRKKFDDWYWDKLRNDDFNFKKNWE